MKTYPCPACGAEVKFVSAVSVCSVCAYCRSTVVRHDLDVESLGKAAVLQDDPSPLQIGTGGKYEKRAFTLVGRLVQKWAEGNWSEWFAYFDDGTTGWLAEAQGFYMLSFDLTPAPSLPPVDQLRAGLAIVVNNQTYVVKDIKQATCATTQGELPLLAKTGRQCTSVDCSGPEESFLCLDYSSEGTRAYLGKYREFDALHFSNLREIDGW